MELSEFGYRRASREYYIAQELLLGNGRSAATKELFKRVGRQEPFIYRENSSVGRIEKALPSQHRIFLYNVNKVASEMVARGWVDPDPISERRKWTSKDRMWVRWRRNFIEDLVKAQEDEPRDIPGFKPRPTFVPTPKQDIMGALIDRKDEDEIEKDNLEFEVVEQDEEIEIPEDVYDERSRLVIEYVEDKSYPRGYREVVHQVHLDIDEVIDLFYYRMMKARAFVLQRELSGQHLDFISTRALKDGCKALAYGISIDEVMEAVVKTWPTETRNEFDNWTIEWKASGESVIKTTKYENPLPGAHRFLGYVMCLAKARIPIFLVGPSGCGKSFLARDLADALDMEYGELPLTAGATPSWLVGAETITGYKSRPFIEIYREGGVFCFEEMDAADPNMLLLVNNALANEFLTNPVTGLEVPKHDDFIPVATANTWGLGANRQFTGRERLDAATLDRWRVGRVEMDYDMEIEKQIVEQWKETAEKLKPKVKKAIKA